MNTELSHSIIAVLATLLGLLIGLWLEARAQRDSARHIAAAAEQEAAVAWSKGYAQCSAESSERLKKVYDQGWQDCAVYRRVADATEAHKAA